MTKHDLIVSINEKGSELIPILENEGVTVRFASLKVADFLIAGRIGIIKRSAAQFAADIKSKMLYRSLIEFKREYPEPLYIIEGKNLANNGTSAMAIRSAISYVAVQNRIPIICTDTVEETSRYISLLLKQSEYSSTEETRSSNEMSKEEAPTAFQLKVLSDLPEINLKIAVALMKKFGSLKAICNASAKTLQSVKGIGPRRATKLKEAIESDLN